ncbi:MAG: radical SAM protein [Candidatus Latescibacter sp.]|nr:radical SAM protein [Candidatus Latescibacter sp.]
MRLTLVSAPLTMEERYGLFSGAGSSQPSFGLVCLAAAAEQEGVKVSVIDASAESLSKERALQAVLKSGADVVGISSTTAGISASGELAEKIKQARPCSVIIGGSHATAIPEETLTEFPGFDMAVVGEGEDTLREILRAFGETGSLSETAPGTAVRINGGIRVNPPRPLIMDLDSLPMPAWHLIRGFPQTFRPSPARMKRFPCASLVFTRGCPNRCHFCDRSVFGNRVRSYSPARAVAMLKELRQTYGVKEILIEDDTFVTSRTWVMEFCGKLLAENIDITWSCLGRADRVTPEILKIMKQAGCWHISYGIESGDEQILKNMGKGENLSHIEDAVRLSRAAGIKTKGFFMVGFPGESEDSLRRTRELALKLPLDDISVMQLTPFPGTAIYSYASQYGTFERDWRKMNVITTVFTPHGFTPGDMEKARSRLLVAFYLRPGIILKKLAEVTARPRLLPYMIQGFLAFLKVVLSTKIGNKRRNNDTHV